VVKLKRRRRLSRRSSSEAAPSAAVTGVAQADDAPRTDDRSFFQKLSPT